jgi:hypothetical protein
MLVNGSWSTNPSDFIAIVENLGQSEREGRALVINPFSINLFSCSHRGQAAGVGGGRETINSQELDD